MQHILRTTVDDTFKLAINTHLDEKSYAKTKMLDFSNGKGEIVNLKNGDSKNWEIEGCTVVSDGQKSDTIFLFGPDFEGVSLIEFFNKVSDKDAYLFINNLISIY